MGWQCVTFSDDQLSVSRHIVLRDTFDIFFKASDSPLDAALFDSAEFPHRMIYFSPGAIRIAPSLAEKFGGIACTPPSRSEVRFLIGHDGLDSIPFR